MQSKWGTLKTPKLWRLATQPMQKYLNSFFRGMPLLELVEIDMQMHATDVLTSHTAQAWGMYALFKR